MFNKNLYYVTLLLISSTIKSFEFTVPTDLHKKRPETWLSPSIPRTDNKRPGSYPFICGDTFRRIANFVIDETLIPFDPAKVTPGDIIFLNGNYLEIFVTNIHPLIQAPYILLTHNSLQPAPGTFESLLYDPKLIAWFGKNITITNHPKLFPLPLGIPNPHWPWGNTQLIKETVDKQLEKKHLLYLNFDIKTNSIRKKVQELFESKNFCYVTAKKPYQEYLEDIAQSKFVLSPEGAGMDCHRTWEALLVGSIPIITHSTLDIMFQDLPVLFVNSWEEVTEEFLEKKYQEITKKTYQLDTLYADYWINIILQIQKQFLKTFKIEL